MFFIIQYIFFINDFIQPFFNVYILLSQILHGSFSICLSKILHIVKSTNTVITNCLLQNNIFFLYLTILNNKTLNPITGNIAVVMGGGKKSITRINFPKAFYRSFDPFHLPMSCKTKDFRKNKLFVLLLGEEFRYQFLELVLKKSHMWFS